MAEKVKEGKIYSIDSRGDPVEQIFTTRRDGVVTGDFLIDGKEVSLYSRVIENRFFPTGNYSSAVGVAESTGDVNMQFFYNPNPDDLPEGLEVKGIAMVGDR